MNKINVLILAAGRGTRFKSYTDTPKPLISIKGEHMYQHVLNNLNIKNPCDIHVLFHKDYKCTTPYITHTIDNYTEGAAESAFHVISKIPSEPWLIVDCDAVIETTPITFDKSSILIDNVQVFDPRASYSYIQEDKILCTAEKQVISKYRNVGAYFWEKGSIFCDAFQIAKKFKYKVNNEYYISPLYNIAISNGIDVSPVFVERFTPIGVPEDLERYLNEINCA